MGTRSTLQARRFGKAGGRLKNDPRNRGTPKSPLGELVQKVRELEREISRKKGPFDFFGLILREDSEKWDLVAAAKWFGDDDHDALSLIAHKLRDALGDEGMQMISRIVMLSRHDTFIAEATEALQLEHGLKAVQDTEFGGVPIVHGFIITSRKLPSKSETK